MSAAVFAKMLIIPVSFIMLLTINNEHIVTRAGATFIAACLTYPVYSFIPVFKINEPINALINTTTSTHTMYPNFVNTSHGKVYLTTGSNITSTKYGPKA